MEIHQDLPYSLHRDMHMKTTSCRFMPLFLCLVMLCACTGFPFPKQATATATTLASTISQMNTSSPTQTQQTGNDASPLPDGTQVYTPTPPPLFFTEEWNADSSDWKWFSTHGNDNLWDVYTEAGVLVYYLTGKEISSYYFYEPRDYDQVKVSTRVENRSKTQSSIVLICNYSETWGWYEFDIGTNGLWQIRVHDSKNRTGYLELKSGGSKGIHTGEAINEYSITCEGNRLSLAVNGTLAVEYMDKILNLSEGKVGIGVLSSNQVPILVEFDWVKISPP